MLCGGVFAPPREPSFGSSGLFFKVPSLSGLDVDCDVYARGEIELLELVDCVDRGVYDVDEAFVCAKLELFHTLLVDVYGAVYRILFDFRRKRNGTRNACASALGGFDDIVRTLVYCAEIVALELDSNSLSSHFCLLSLNITILQLCGLRLPEPV